MINKRMAAIIILLFLWTGLSPVTPAYSLSAGKLVNLEKFSQDFVLDLKYATADNFMKTKLYDANICCLQEDTAWKLIKANEALMQMGYRIKIWDAYRPLAVQKAMWKKMPDSRYLANPYKGGSKHNRGAAVDITLVDKNGKEVEMPSRFDDFSAKAGRNNPHMSAAAKRNLKILTDAMVKNGFQTIKNEWWHYDDKNSSNYAIQDIPLKRFENIRLPVDSLQCINDSSQVILITSDIKGSYKARLNAYEKKNGQWLQVFPEIAAIIGKNGFKPVKTTPLGASDKKYFKYEGDNCSPIGAFSIDTLFGWGDNPGFRLPYRKTTEHDYWVSDNKKESYNIWVHKTGGPDKSWDVYEKLKVTPYKYAAVINYNMGPDRIVGNGSAMFLHIMPKAGYTHGCTAISETDLVKVLKWLKPEMKPLLVQGPASEVGAIHRK
jgi:zinc D-Ala-D-Ala dipeptidase